MTWVFNREKKDLVWVISRDELVRLAFHGREIELIQAEAEGLPFYDMELGRESSRRYDLYAVAVWIRDRARRRASTQR